MRILALAPVILAAACATPAPAPSPPPPPPPAIETSAVTPATRAPTPTVPAQRTAVPAQDLPASLTRDRIDKTFGHHRRYFQDLYLGRLQARRGLTGTMQVNLVINADGSIGPVTLFSSTLADPPLEQAVLEQVGRMTFPPARTATEVVRYPIEFSVPGHKP